MTDDTMKSAKEAAEKIYATLGGCNCQQCVGIAATIIESTISSQVALAVGAAYGDAAQYAEDDDNWFDPHRSVTLADEIRSRTPADAQMAIANERASAACKERDAWLRLFSGKPPIPDDVDDEMRAEALVEHDRLVRLPLEEALRGILEIGKRDMSNPKYDGYFEHARAILSQPAPKERP